MKQVCVIGLGQFGTHVARALVRLGCEVLGIDLDEQRVERVRDELHRALIGDARDFEMLQNVLSASVDEVVICLGEKNLEPSILCTLHAKRVGVRTIRSTATNDDHAAILKAVGATETIFPERDAADRTARLIANPDIRDMFPLTESFRILEMRAPKQTHGKSLAELDLRKKFELLILATRREDEEAFHFLPEPTKVVTPDEVLMVVGRELDLARFEAFD